jgi:hypothetical protein
MVQVFKTNISRRRDALNVISFLKRELPSTSIHIDLQDCDKVLRVDLKRKAVDQQEIIDLVRSFDFYCEELTT